MVEYNFVAQVVMDPSDHTHLLITFHATCGAPHTEACFGESTDSGSTWHLIDGQADWAGGEGQAVYFLNDSKTWLWGSQSNGLWRTLQRRSHLDRGNRQAGAGTWRGPALPR